MPSPQIERKLAAIMFTDIAGYTESMSKSESKTLNLLEKKRSILKPLLDEYKGTFVKEIGDGTLSYFESAVNAATCVVKLQENTYDDKDMNIRVGIHFGDIVFKDGDVFGDDVNIASRVEGFAPVGGISLSDKVHKDISGVSDIKTSFIGHRKLKGVQQETKIRCITSNNLPKHRKQLFPLIVGYIGICLGLFITSMFLLGAIMTYYDGGQLLEQMRIYFMYGGCITLIGYSNIMYVKGISIKSQRLILYFS